MLGVLDRETGWFCGRALIDRVSENHSPLNGLVGVIGMKSPAYQTSFRNFAMEPSIAARPTLRDWRRGEGNPRSPLQTSGFCTEVTKTRSTAVM
jgi:hypothetical protein